MHFNDILTFWFHEIEPKQWWKKDKKFDDLLRCRFLNIHSLAIKRNLNCEKGRLAEIIVIDQFSEIFLETNQKLLFRSFLFFYQKRYYLGLYKIK